MNDMRTVERTVDNQNTKISARNVQVHYGTSHAITVYDGRETAPAGASPRAR